MVVLFGVDGLPRLGWRVPVPMRERQQRPKESLQLLIPSFLLSQAPWQVGGADTPEWESALFDQELFLMKGSRQYHRR
jgi:hypothetical protein